MRDLARDTRFLSINTATVRAQWDLRQAIEGVARAGIPGIAPWRDQLQAMGVAAAAKAIRAHGLAVTGLCRGGMFTGFDRAGLARALDDNRRAVDEAAALGAQCLVLVVGGLAPHSRDLAAARDLVKDGIAALLPHARAAKMPLAIEPLHDRGMMGDGVIDLRRIRGWVEAAGYAGFCEVEIFSAENWWRRPPEDVLATCIDRYRSVC